MGLCCSCYPGGNVGGGDAMQLKSWWMRNINGRVIYCNCTAALDLPKQMATESVFWCVFERGCNGFQFNDQQPVFEFAPSKKESQSQ